MLSNAVLGDLVSRSMSFFFAKCEKQTTATTIQDDLQRLRHLLLRSGTIIEEAERRHVTNRSMLLQLKALRDETLRGYYVLDTVSFRAASAGGDDAKKGKEEVSRRAFALSSFNAAKRVRFPSGDSELTTVSGGGAAASSRELRQIFCNLETMIGDMKEFVVFLSSYPSLYRQPYSTHLFLNKCMFGRHMERERVMEFLLQLEPPGAESLSVLPIYGPAHIGKSTLVEHVCDDERVRNHFSSILVYSGNDLKDATTASPRGRCLIKHQNDKASGERLLIVIELLEDVDEETWKRLYSSERSMAQGSKIIITSRSENIARFGTTQALRLRCLSAEAYWYFFKMLVFGSDDPGQHPKKASLALEIAHVMQGSFLFAYIGAILLRANFNTQSWSRVLSRVKEYLQKNASIIGEYSDDIKAKDHLRFTWSLIKQKPDKYFMLDDIYQRDSAQEEVPEISMVDLLAGCAQPRGVCEILIWKSQIAPYFSYACKCETRDM